MLRVIRNILVMKYNTGFTSTSSGIVLQLFPHTAIICIMFGNN